VSGRRYEIDGRTVFVTGAARGIGAAVAERMHAAGANVVLVGLEAERLEELEARLGDRALAVEADVTDTAALERAVRSAVDRFGGIDVAIANAGIAFLGALATTPVEQVERTLAVNLLGVWRTDRAVLPQVIERRGYLLNVASLAAALHTPLLGPYTAAKAGVEALSDSLRVELAPTGARVGCAYFGIIDTDLARAGMAHPAAGALPGLVPATFRRPAPVSVAVDAIEAGIRRGSARVWAPRWVGAALLARGIMQPLTERIGMRSGRLAASIQLADPQAGGDDDEHALLGIAKRARPGVQAGERPRA
jgi:NAD(P)-dependent dehydrogenase (short-subunit alcohol dehydrogenase family)